MEKQDPVYVAGILREKFLFGWTRIVLRCAKIRIIAMLGRKKKMFKVPEQYRVKTGKMASDESYGNNGAFVVPCEYETMWQELIVIASDGEGWEHVSVSLRHRCPTWNEMNFIKDLFWDAEDTVIQYHPPKSEYVNCHPHVLHLWRPIGIEIPLPPRKLIG